MRIQFPLIFFIIFCSISSYGQFTFDEFTKQSLNSKIGNTWAFGGGMSQFIMHGDLRSIGTGSQGDFFNFGGYLYVDKMFNPILGIEFKLNYNQISGGAQYFSDVYDVLYVDNQKITNNLFFEGRAYGAEVNLIFSLTNLDNHVAQKWHFAAYAGIGYHQYNSALYERNTDGSSTKLVDFGFNPARNNVREASSVFIAIQGGLKRRINHRLDLEFRPGWYFNFEDHLDAAISNKQDWETFFVVHLGVVFKLGKKDEYTIWGEDYPDLKDDEPFKIIDTDKYGVIDQLDKEPNTPLGVLVYGNGVSIDTDEDGLPDYKDKCRYEKGPLNNNGCPIIGDRDKDGVPDLDDKCIDVKGLERYQGCPDEESLKVTEIVQVMSYSKNIYFDTGSNQIKSAVYYSMLDEVASIMLKNKDV